MSWLARRITKARWSPDSDETTLDSIRSEVLRDLDVKQDTLSFWVLDDLDAIADLAVAIASTRDSISQVDVAWIPQSVIAEEDITTNATLGATPLEDFREAHVDLVELNVRQVVALVQSLARAVRTEGGSKRFRDKEVTTLIAERVASSRLPATELPEGIRTKIAPLL